MAILNETMCSAQTRAADLSPAGSGPSYTDYLLVGWAMPWPSKVALMGPLGEIEARLAELGPPRRVRVQAVVPAGARRPEGNFVVRWSRIPGGFRGFERQRLEVDSPEDLAAACEQIMHTVPSTSVNGNGSVHAAGSSARATRDVLVCGHGSRDVCCGRLGPRLVADLDDVPDEVSLWRSSHLGGHRYAPTALSFPEGAYWGFLDPPTLRAVLHRDPEPATIIDHYRGSAGFDHPGSQLVEAALLVQEGWASLDYEKTATVTPGDGVDEVELQFVRPDGSPGALRGVSERVRQVQLTECEGPGPGELVDEHRLVELHRLDRTRS